MKVFISYHRKDTKYKNRIIEILKENNINYYCVPEKMDFSGWTHQNIAEFIYNKLEKCDILLCIVGEETFSRPHVDMEIHAALKGSVCDRKGIIAVMLEKRGDSKNNINYVTFPVKLAQNEHFIVLQQFASFHATVNDDIQQAFANKNNSKLHVTHKNRVMQLKSGKYYEIN